MSEWKAPWAQRLYQKRKTAHKCVNCGKQDDRTIKGLTCCKHCAAVQKTSYNNTDESKRKAANKKAYIKNVQNHKCPRCKHPLPQDYYYTVCASCREKQRDDYQKKKTAGAATPNGQS